MRPTISKVLRVRLLLIYSGLLSLAEKLFSIGSPESTGGKFSFINPDVVRSNDRGGHAFA